MSLPDGLKPEWENVVKDLYSMARRCQQMGRRQEGYAAIRLIMFVNQDGAPVFWLSPEMVTLEPKNRLTLDILKDVMERADEKGVDMGGVLFGS